MTIRRFETIVTTAADGTATAYSPYIDGEIISIQYVKTDFADGVDFTITAEANGQAIWSEADVNAAVTKAPRLAVHTVAGAAALYAAGGVAVLDRIALGRDRIKYVIAQGGNAKTGKFVAIVDDGRR
jgi:hypothetical protein